MKIRAITTGISLDSSKDLEKLKSIAEFNYNAKAYFEERSYEVQTTRIATNSWEEYIDPYLSHKGSTQTILSEICEIENFCQKHNVGFLSIGPASEPASIAIVPLINKKTSIVYCSSTIADIKNGINFENISHTARIIKAISEETKNGYGNFRFCASANCQAGIPFFPAAYHVGESSFSIGLECSDLLMIAFSKSRNLIKAKQNLLEIFEYELKKVEEISQEVADKFKISYGGIDASVAPSLERDESIAFAYEKLEFGKFGEQGTLAISAAVTQVLKSLSVKLCGYSGLMLPVCEDVGLAERANEQTYNLTNLLLYSSVCGCGLDTVPLSGDLTTEKLEMILLDVASLAIKLDKPLSARLLLVPGKDSGEITSFNSPYLVDCKTLPV